MIVAPARRGWRRLLRMSTALALLATLATAAAIATFVPQEPVVPDTVAAWRSPVDESGPGPTVTALLDAAGLFDVFGAWWFMALLGLLVVSLTGCLTLRYAALWRAGRRPPALAPPPTRPPAYVVRSTSPGDGVVDDAARLLARRGFRVVRSDTVVMGERGRWREAGSLAFHTSIYLLLAGAIVGHTLGFAGQVDLAEGRGFTDTPVSYDSAEAGRLFDAADHGGALVTLDEFALATHPDGSPADYVASVTIGEGPRAREEQVRINHPARAEGAVVHLVRYGVATELVVRDADGGEVFRDAVRLRGAGGGAWAGAAKVRLGDPADATQLALDVAVLPATSGGSEGSAADVADPRAGRSAALPSDPTVLVDLYAGDLGLEVPAPLDEVRPGWGPRHVVGRATLREGAVAALGPGHTVELVEVGAWAGFQVSHAPGRGLLLAGAALMLVGLGVSLTSFRRRIWVSATADGAAVAGRAWHRGERAADELRAVAEELRDTVAERAPAPHATTMGGRS